MQTLHQHVVVRYDYDVHFTHGLFEPGNPLLARAVGEAGRAGAPPAKALAVLDAGMLEHHPDLPDRIAAYAEAHPGALTFPTDPVVVPGGEAAKNDPALVETLWRAIYDIGLCRHSYVLAVGGGAVLDLAGYAAATAHRSVRLVRVPTTVLAQNDSGVGVKNGINAFGAKNFVGTFVPPRAVLNDAAFLDTLSDRDWRAGTAEAVKVALVKDAAFFEAIADDAAALAAPCRDGAAMNRLIHRCAALHLDHIATSGDPFELGSSRPLDFGHWAAHKLEVLTDYALRHGEAVAIGIALDTVYSELSGRLSAPEAGRVLDVLEALGFALHVPALSEAAEASGPRGLFAGLDEFREHLGGELTVMLLAAIGRGVEVHEVDRALYRQAVGRLRERAGAACPA